jgi:hypothetical protein
MVRPQPVIQVRDTFEFAKNHDCGGLGVPGRGVASRNGLQRFFATGVANRAPGRPQKTRVAPARCPKPPPGRGSLLRRTSENSSYAYSGEGLPEVHLVVHQDTQHPITHSRSGGAPTRYPVQSAPHPPPRPPTTSFRAFSRLQHSYSPAGMQVEQVAGGMVTHPPSVLTRSHPPATSSSCRSESSSPWPSGETLGSTR